MPCLTDSSFYYSLAVLYRGIGAPILMEAPKRCLVPCLRTDVEHG